MDKPGKKILNYSRSHWPIVIDSTEPLPPMHNVSHSLPKSLPGIQVEFALKQCLGKPDLLVTLLGKFWDDYKDTPTKLDSNSLDSIATEKLLHDLQGAAFNLGLSDLGDASQRLRDSLGKNQSLNGSAKKAFNIELEKVGSSIKTLDSAIQS